MSTSLRTIKLIRLQATALLCCYMVAGTGCGLLTSRHFSFNRNRIDPTLEGIVLSDLSVTEPERLPDSASEVLQEMNEVTAPDGSRISASVYPESLEMSLEDARAAALQGNLNLRVVSFDPDIAGQRIFQEIWQFESTFQGTLSRNRLDGPPDSVVLGAPPERATDRFDPAIVMPLTTGGRLTFRSSGTRSQLVGMQKPNIHDLAPTLTFNQPLLRNAGTFVNTARIQLASLDQGRADASTKLTAIRIVAETERAYWVVLGVQKNLEIARQQIAIAEAQTSAARKLANAGIVTQVDVLRSERGLSFRRELVVRAERDVILAMRDLKRVMQAPGLPVESTTEIEIASEPNLIGLRFDREQLASNALSNRLELIDLALQLEQQSVNVAVAENSVLPELNFVFEGKLLGTGTTDGIAARQAWGENYDEWFTGLTFSVPLAGNQSARRRVRESELVIARTAASQAELEVAIVTQINDAVDRFEKNWERINILQQTVALAKETYTAETRLFELGQRTSDLVLLAAAGLADAQLQLVQSIIDFQISRVDIAIATGTVLGYSGVAFADEPAPSIEPEPIAPPPVDIAPLLPVDLAPVP